MAWGIPAQVQCGRAPTSGPAPAAGATCLVSHVILNHHVLLHRQHVGVADREPSHTRDIGICRRKGEKGSQEAHQRKARHNAVAVSRNRAAAASVARHRNAPLTDIADGIADTHPSLVRVAHELISRNQGHRGRRVRPAVRQVHPTGRRAGQGVLVGAGQGCTLLRKPNQSRLPSHGTNPLHPPPSLFTPYTARSFGCVPCLRLPSSWSMVSTSNLLSSSRSTRDCLMPSLPHLPITPVCTKAQPSDTEIESA